jgi:hypothetical protein
MIAYCDELSSLANCVMVGVYDTTCPRLSTAWISCNLRNWALHWNASHLGVRSHCHLAFCLIERALILFATLACLKLILQGWAPHMVFRSLSASLVLFRGVHFHLYNFPSE